MPKKSSTVPAKRPATRAAAKRTPPTVVSEPVIVTSDAIARRAYEIFVEHGSPHGHDLEHWLAAERELSEGA